MQLETQIPSLSYFIRKYLTFALGWVQVVCLVYSLLTIRENTHWWTHFFSTWIISEIATFTCFWGQYGLMYLIAFIKGQKPIFKSLSSSALRSFIFLPLGIYFGVKVRTLIWHSLGLHSTTWNWEHLYDGIILGSICIGIFIFLSNYIEKKQKAKELEIENLNNKLTTLSLQMNPHFLFNILNNLAESIYSQPEIAEKITLELAELLRKILAATKKEKHALSEELSLCYSFINLEKLRYEIKIIENIENNLEIMKLEIPVMIVQPLLENAIHHGRRAPIKLDIYSKDKFLIIKVSNYRDTNEKDLIFGTKTALQNINTRLKLAYSDDKANLTLQHHESHLTVATLVLPIGPI